MEPISEERQLRVYEWLYPELKGKAWWIEVSDMLGELWATWHDDSPMGHGERHLPHLYGGFGVPGSGNVPNYQSFFTEIVPRLEKDGHCYVSFDTRVAVNEFRIVYRKDEVHYYGGDADPIAATAEYVEALEGYK